MYRSDRVVFINILQISNMKLILSWIKKSGWSYNVLVFCILNYNFKKSNLIKSTEYILPFCYTSSLKPVIKLTNKSNWHFNAFDGGTLKIVDARFTSFLSVTFIFFFGKLSMNWRIEIATNFLKIPNLISQLTQYFSIFFDRNLCHHRHWNFDWANLSYGCVWHEDENVSQQKNKSTTRTDDWHCESFWGDSIEHDGKWEGGRGGSRKLKI